MPSDKVPYGEQSAESVQRRVKWDTKVNREMARQDEKPRLISLTRLPYFALLRLRVNPMERLE